MLIIICDLIYQWIFKFAKICFHAGDICSWLLQIFKHIRIKHVKIMKLNIALNRIARDYLKIFWKIALFLHIHRIEQHAPIPSNCLKTPYNFFNLMYIHANNHQLIGGESPSLFDWHFVFWTHPSSTKEPTEAMIYHIFFGKSLSRTILISKGVIQWFKICIKNERAIHLTSQSPLPRNVFFYST